MEAHKKIWVALDLEGLEPNLEIAKLVAGLDAVRGFKVNSLFDEWAHRGPDDIDVIGELKRLCREQSKRLWLDLKIHDVPPTVRRRVKAHRTCAGEITVMAKGGIDMMRAAVEAADVYMNVIAVTELTSNSEEEVDLGSGHSAKASVLQLARNAVLAGVRHLVCSTNELKTIVSREELKVLRPVVPGISLGGIVGEGQSRVGSLTNLIESCSYAEAVIGSAIIKADDPVAAVEQATREIEAVKEAV